MIRVIHSIREVVASPAFAPGWSVGQAEAIRAFTNEIGAADVATIIYCLKQNRQLVGSGRNNTVDSLSDEHHCCCYLWETGENSYDSRPAQNH